MKCGQSLLILEDLGAVGEEGNFTVAAGKGMVTILLVVEEDRKVIGVVIRINGADIRSMKPSFFF